jgi:predicted protein tyrosine phosphatase
MGVPDVNTMRAITNAIRGSINSAPAVYIHCWGGIGRTGTVVGCWLVERESADGDPVEALRPLRGDCKKAHRRSPDTDEQEEFVRSWTRPEGSEA